MHTHNPVWSTDGEWIYFGHGRERVFGEMDVWRMRPSGESVGAAHIPERTCEFSGADRFTHSALYRARGGWIRTVAMGPRCGEQGHAPRDCRARTIYVRLGKPGWPSHRRDRGQSHGELVAPAVGRSARRGSRRAALPRPKRIAPRHRASEGLHSFICRSPPVGSAMACGVGSTMARRSKYERAPTACCWNRPQHHQMAAAWRSS